MAIRGKIYIKNANGTIFFDISDGHASGDNTLKMRLFFNVSDKYKVRKKKQTKFLYMLNVRFVNIIPVVQWREFCVPDTCKGKRMYCPKR